VEKKKDAANKKTDGISFVEVETPFADDNGLLIYDSDHSGDEERFALSGLSSSLYPLAVCHAYGKNESAMRIISARKATRTQQEQYWRG
jgi:uncharacterized protein